MTFLIKKTCLWFITMVKRWLRKINEFLSNKNCVKNLRKGLMIIKMWLINPEIHPFLNLTPSSLSISAPSPRLPHTWTKEVSHLWATGKTIITVHLEHNRRMIRGKYRLKNTRLITQIWNLETTNPSAAPAAASAKTKMTSGTANLRVWRGCRRRKGGVEGIWPCRESAVEPRRSRRMLTGEMELFPIRRCRRRKLRVMVMTIDSALSSLLPRPTTKKRTSRPSRPGWAICLSTGQLLAKAPKPRGQ